MANKKLNILQQARLYNIYRETINYIHHLSKKYEDDQLIASTLLNLAKKDNSKENYYYKKH